MTDVRAERWEGATAAELAARWGVPAVHLFERIGSTNDAARALADAGAPRAPSSSPRSSSPGAGAAERSGRRRRGWGSG